MKRIYTAFIDILRFIWHKTYIRYRNYRSIKKEHDRWAEKKVSYGRENPDKTFYVIRRREVKAGLFSYFLQNVNDIKYALDRDWIPVIDLQNELNMYIREDEVGKINAWEYFFEQPCGYSLKDIRKSRNVILGSGYLKECFPYKDISYITDFNGPFSEYRDIVKKYCRPTNEVKGILTDTINRLGINERTLGVLCRGTDYTTVRPHGHFIQPEPEELFDEIDGLLANKSCDIIFVATEDKEVYSKFKDKYGDLVVTNRDDFIDYNGENSLGQKTKDSRADLKNEGITYLISMLVLSRCRFFIGGATSGTVGVMLMADGYEHLHIFDKGLYP